ncbi:MAG: TRAP transporter small permease [Betaproteobacteria bacterium]|nr:TRAP transporter small permease [Betaproteobacteria bacterium]
MRNADASHARPAVGSRVRVAGWLTQLTRWLCLLSGLLALLLPLPVLFEVFMDQIGDPPIWVFETTGYAILMIACTAAGYGLNTGHHFRVALVSQKFPRLALPLALLSGLLEAAFGAMLALAGWNMAHTSWVQGLRSDTLLAVPQFWPQLALPIGGLAILLQGLSHLLAPPDWGGESHRFLSNS